MKAIKRIIIELFIIGLATALVTSCIREELSDTIKARF